jgi:hypothetical protein
MTSTRNPPTTITVVSVFLLTTHPLTCRPSGQPPQKPGRPEGYPGPITYKLASFRAAAAEIECVLLDLVALVVDDELGDRYREIVTHPELQTWGAS